MSPTLRTALSLSGLAAIALLAEPLTGLADTIAAGRLGVHEQASLALGSSIATTAAWLVTPVLFAQTTEVARLRAAGQHTEAARTTRAALAAATGFGLVLGVVLVGVAMCADLSDGARDYVLARAVGLPITALVMAGYGALRGSRAVHTVSILALTGAAVHIVLDISTVLWTQLGLAGLGLASIVSQLVLAGLVLRTLRSRALLDVGTPRALPNRSATWQSAPALLVLAARSATLGASTIVLTSVAVGIDPVTGAAHQVTYQFWILAALAVEGWKSAAQIMVSSAASPTEGQAVERSLLRSSAVLGAAAGVVMVGVMPWVVEAMSADDRVAEVARSIWPLGALAIGIGAVAFTRDGIEYGRASYVANLARIVAGTAVWLAGAWVSHATNDIRWMWWAMSIGLLVRAMVPFGGPRAVFRRSKRRADPRVNVPA